MKSERIPSLTTSVNNGQLLLLKPVDTEPLPLISGLLLVTATNGFSTPPFMLGEPIILSAVLETGDTTQNLAVCVQARARASPSACFLLVSDLVPPVSHNMNNDQDADGGPTQARPKRTRKSPAWYRNGNWAV